MYVFLSLVLIILTIYSTWFLNKKRYMERCLGRFPGPKNVFFFGCALDFMRNDKGMLAVFREYQKKYGDIVYGRFGFDVHSLIFTNADFAKTIFSADINLSKGIAYDYAKCWLGNGLLTTSEKNWKIQRRMITPAFNNQLIQNFVEIFDKQSDVLIEKMRALAPIDSLNIHPLISKCSLDIICNTSMGVLLGSQENQNSDYVNSVKEMCRIISARSLSVWKSIGLIFLFSEDYRKQQKCLKTLHSYTDKVINERKKERIKNSNNTDQKYHVLLDTLLDYSETEKRLSENEIRQEVHTFMFAGHDTVSAAMDFCIFEIAKHPEIQASLYEEQLNIYGNDSTKKNITLRDIHEMKYLDAVIKETMRMYPPVPVYLRCVTKEFMYDGKIIPKDTILIHFAYGLHRNEESFPNPEIFDPTRFINNEYIKYSYLPFSTGPRNCIGQKFAMYEMKVILSKLIRNFIFHPSIPEHVLDLRAEVVLKSVNGVNVKIVPRNCRH